MSMNIMINRSLGCVSLHIEIGVPPQTQFLINERLKMYKKIFFLITSPCGRTFSNSGFDAQNGTNLQALVNNLLTVKPCRLGSV